MRDAREFFGFSLVCFPAILGLSWAVFQLLKNKLPRSAAVIVSCAAVVVGSLLLEMQGRGSSVSPNAAYEIIDAVLAAAVGLIFWGKPKQSNLPPSSDNPPDVQQ